MSSPLIRRGERSAQVVDVQARLRALGIDIADVTGHFGVDTEKAVRDFQQRRGILVDGIVGPNTWGELVEASWRLGDRNLYLTRPLTRGDDVLVLQARLNALGYNAGREDGIYGNNTATAVRAFQREYAVAEDGIFGPRTHDALLGLRADRPATAAPLREQLRRSERAGLGDALVIIDPGHGGEDAGEIANGSLGEADICWDIAVRLARNLAEAGARARFTRTENENPDHALRAERANDLDADVCVSLHLNHNPEPTAEGAATFYFPRSTAGEQFAECTQRALVALGLRDCRAHARSYPILKETKMPAILVEPAFISNPDEAKRLQDAGFREELARALAGAIKVYFEQVEF